MDQFRKNLKEKQSLIREHEDEIAALKITITELRSSLKSPTERPKEDINEEDNDSNDDVIHPQSARERYFYREDDSETEENRDSSFEEDQGFQNNMDSYFVNQENEEDV